jgi:hypothetical protein
MPTVTGRATDFITFTRTSNATVTDSNGFIKWAGHNLLTNSESFDASAWAKSSATVTANTDPAPNGTTTGDTIAASGANGTALQTWTAEAVPYTFGVWLRRKTGTGNIQIAADSGTYTTVTITSSWALYTVTQTPASGSKSAGIRIVTSGDEVYAWGAHLYRSDLGGMVLNPARGDAYYPTTPRNLLGYTESLTTGWTNTNTTDSIVTETNPNSLASSVEVTATAGNGTLLGSLSLLASPYTFSIWLKRKTGTGTVEITVDGTTYVAAAVTGTWTRFSTTLTPTAGTKTPGIRLVTSGDAVFAWGAQLSDSASLDAYSPVYDAAVTSAAYYAPRLDFDPVTLAAKGLLVEELRANVVPYSSELASWSDSGATVTSNAVIAPDGTLTADDLARSSSVSDARLQAVTFTGDGSKSFSVYVKYNTSPSFMLFVYDVTATAGRAQIEFGFTAGVPAATTTTSGSVEAVENVGGGWYRIKIIAAGVVAANTNRVYLYPARTGSADGQKTTFWGAQAENASFATSYIPTGASTATRTADVASVSTQAFPYSASEGTLVGEVRGLLSSTITQVPLVNFGDANNRIELRAVGDPFTYNRAVVVNSGSTVVDINATGLPASASATRKVGLAFKLNDFATTGTGGTVGTTSSGTIPSVSVMNIGTAPYFASLKTNGWIARITYIPRRLSNSELQARTV